MYLIARTYGRSVDYLSSWDSEYGTQCMGSPNLALRFNWFAEAKEAAMRANQECCGTNGAKKPADMVFSVVYVEDEAHP